MTRSRAFHADSFKEKESVYSRQQKLPGPGTRAILGPTKPCHEQSTQQEQGILKLRLIPSIALPSSNRFNCIVYSYSGKTSCWLNLPSGLRPLCFSIGDWKRVGAHSLHLSWKVYRSQQQFLGQIIFKFEIYFFLTNKIDVLIFKYF